MRRLRTLLVAVRDLRARRNVAIERAATLAAGSGARLELFHDLATPVYVDTVVGTGKSLQTITKDARAQALRQLERLAEPLRARGLKVGTAAVWDYPPYEAVIRRAMAIGADLIVAHKHGHHRMPALLGHTDWALLRASPIPVLLIKSARARPRAAVIAAIDPSHTDAKPANLDRHILETAAAVSAALRAPLHAVHVTAPWARTPAHRRALQSEVARTADIKPARTHLLEGIPDVLLPITARRLRAGVVVMGDMSRRGLKRWFVGNTAERLIDDLACDLLIVKPAQFKTRLPRARRGVYYLTTLPMA
jgi:universal stress protein E